MKIALLLIILLTLFFIQTTQSQILYAGTAKSLKANLMLIQREVMSFENQNSKPYFSGKDSVDFKLDAHKIMSLIHRDSVYTHVEEEAYFMDNKEEMLEYISKNISKSRKKKGTKVVIKLIVENFGGISHPHVLSCGNDEKLANEVLKIVQTMKIWTPAKILGFDVNSYYTINFIY
jgi:hypothetical protein